jgi:CDP-glycerol glycerophosphotransferase
MTERARRASRRAIRRPAAALRGVIRRARDRVSPRLSKAPLVSVVLPIYQVEAFLRECLDSIVSQSLTDYELLVVDDGSTDGSRAIAEEYARSDSRVKVIERENGGLGAARNTGVQHARGVYLAFVDSDDVLPPGALRALVASAEATGSDMVAGSVLRFNRLRSWSPSWVNEVHGDRRERIRIEEFLPLLRNLYTWNKLFRRDFWDAQGLSFREGVAYEDQPIITQLYARAASIDVLTDVVYHYRVREDASSISQQTASLSDLRDRVAAWRTTRDVLQREARSAVYLGWLQTLFDAHFHWYLASPGTESDQYWNELREAVVELCADATDETWRRTTPHRRIALMLTLQDRRADAQELVRAGAGDLEQWPSRVRDDGVLLELPFLGDPALPEQLFLLHPEQLRVAHSVENMHWVESAGNGSPSVAMSGWAFVAKIDLAAHVQHTAVVLTGPDGAEHVHHSQPSLPAYAPPLDDLWCDSSAGTFRVEIPLGALAQATGPDASWLVSLRVRVAGFTVTRPVRRLVRAGSAVALPAAFDAEGNRLVAAWRMPEQLRFRVLATTLEADQVAVLGRRLHGRLTGSAGGDVSGISVRSGDVVHPGALDERGEFTLDLPPASSLPAGAPHTSVLVAHGRDGAPVAVACRSMPVPVAHLGDRSEVVVHGGRNGELTVQEWSCGAAAGEVQVTAAGILRVSGRIYGPRPEGVALLMRSKKTRVLGEPAAVGADGQFVAELALRHEVYRFGPQVLPIGDYELSAVLRHMSESQVEVPLRVGEQLDGSLPVLVHAGRYDGRLVRGPRGGVRLTLVRPLGDARGRYRQRQLQTRPRSGVTRGVLMRSYFGEQATDNGVSIQRELRDRGSDLPVYWAVQDFAVPVPEGGIPVVVNTRDWYQLLGTVQYYVDNMYQPSYHVKPAHQVLVQTFHGYPFKQMGHPHWRNLRFSQARIDGYVARARQWDYLVSPARYATPLLCRDFAYDGEVLEIGYPRNDVLQSPDAPRLREQVRASLGIAPDQVAVLYAPTFRDYLAASDVRAVMPDFFDFAEAQRLLGPEYVIMVRGHAFNARTRQRVGTLPGSVDVTDYPEVSDLYLASDAAVVDYSSLRFDYGVTGKPMVFHVPDLQRYKDTRGWLFDFEPTAPGPFAETTTEVAKALADLDGLERQFAGEYAAFRERYLDLEDGHAAARFVDAVFVPRGDV